VFGELIVPLAEDLPFIYNLQAEAGIRYSDYNTTGGNVTWKAGGSYEPFDGFKFRGMYQVAVRSPNIQELFQSPILALATRQTDPCQGSLPVGNPGLAALCVATGAPAGTIGQIPSPSANQINTTTSGNRNLDVERAKTYTLGLVITPPQIPSLSVTIDYFNIRIEDAISRPGTGDILSGCYDASLNPNYEDNAFCQLISRNPLTGGLNGTGETLGVVLTSSNLGTIETAGVDFAVNYRLELADLGIDGEPGALHLGVNGTWLDRYYFQATPNAINRDCTGYYSTNCGNPRQKWKWNARATYSTDSFDVSLLWTHLGASDLEPYLATPITPLDTPQPGGPNPTATSTTTVVYNGVTYTNVPANGILEQYRKLPAYDYFDLSLRFRVDERFELGLLVENLFDQEPPNYPGVGISNAAIFDVLGRTYTISARMRF
jgi:outer membrane receptor protein involved in Fe transport